MKPCSILAAVIGVVFFAMSNAAQSETNCPTIEVNGPSGIPRPGEFIRYTAKAGGTDQQQLSFVWTLSAGKIVSGQRTRSILVDTDRSITATVEIGGLPAGCPNSASEYANWGDPPPMAEKLYEVPGHQALSELNIGYLSSTLRDNPNNQMYVIIHGKDDDSNQRRENEIVRAFKSKGIAADRITMVTVLWDPSITQFWRIPPGASNPEPGQFGKENGNAKSCPTISVTGPAGVVLPGDPMTFVVDVEPESAKRLGFKWDVTDSVIMGGQYTRVVKARYLPQAHGKNVFATVIIDGLANGCPNTASATHPVTVEPECVHLGAINNPSYTIGAELLATIGYEMRTDLSSQLYVWIYYGQNERQLENLKAHILRQLSATKIDPSRITLDGSSEKSRGAIFWSVPPGANNPSP